MKKKQFTKRIQVNHICNFCNFRFVVLVHMIWVKFSSKMISEKWILNWISSTLEKNNQRSKYYLFWNDVVTCINIAKQQPQKIKFLSNSNPNLTPNFLKTVVDRAKRFSPTVSPTKWVIFTAFWKLKSCRKIETKVITVRKMVKLRIHSSVATVEAHKSESGVESNFYIYKRIQKKRFWSEVRLRARPPPAPVLAYLRCSCSKL